MTILSNTRYEWRLDIIRKHAKIGEAQIKSCTIDYVEKADVTKTMKAQIPVNGFNIKNTFIKQEEDIIYFDGTRCFDDTWCFASIAGKWISTENKVDLFSDRLRPIMIINDQEYNFGDFMVVAAPVSYNGMEQYYDVEAYDETMIIKQSALTARKYFQAGTSYLSVIGALLIDCGLTRIMGDNTSKTITVDHEYAIGTSYLDIINELLTEINYAPIYAGEDGNMMLTQKSSKIVADYVYSDENSTIIDSIKSDTDIYSLPNVIVGYTSSPDTSTVLRYTKTNSDPNSAISTSRRGYSVVEVLQLDDCPDLATLQQAVNYKYLEATQATENVTVATMPDGAHPFGTYVSVSENGIANLYREIGWSIEFGGQMQHKLERKVFV